MASSTPEGLQIRPRHLDFDLPDPLPRHWHGGDAFKSHLFDAMSVLFPDGERFFIDSVRQFRDQITDPTLKEQIRGFIGQEGHHSREHLEYSQRLRDLGYAIEPIERRARGRIRYAQKRLSPQRQLAATAALEHITAIMADQVLREPECLRGADANMARLWRWHALEETEHKAVAFDVYQQVCGNRRLLRRAMRLATLFFVLDTPAAWCTCSGAMACCGTGGYGATACSGCGAGTACSGLCCAPTGTSSIAASTPGSTTTSNCCRGPRKNSIRNLTPPDPPPLIRAGSAVRPPHCARALPPWECARRLRR